MSTQDIAVCSMCQVTFPSHEEILVHTCLQVKEEPNEIDTNKQLDICDQEDFQNKNCFSCLDLSQEFLIFILKQVDDLCENIKNGDLDIERTTEVNQNLINAVTFYKCKLNLKKDILIDTDKNSEFKLEIDDGNEKANTFNDLKALGENKKKLIAPSKKIYDENFELVKNQCGRHTTQSMSLMLNMPKVTLHSRIKKAGITFTEKQEKCHFCKLEKHNVKDYSISKEVPKENPKMLTPTKFTLKIEKQTKKYNEEKFEIVKKQCGRHKLSSMAMLLNIPKSTLHGRIKKEGIIFEKKLIGYSWDCQLCEMEKNNAVAKKDDLLHLLRFNQDEEMFQCSICNFLFAKKEYLVKHLRSIHKNEINAKAIMNNKSERNQCDGSVCKKVYGKGKGKEFWCTKCSKKLQLAKELKKESRAGVCPECGLFVNNLNIHCTHVHYGEKQVCSLCSHEFGSLKLLKNHNRAVHEKVPCTLCGKLIGIQVMNRHIKSAHTSDEQKKYKCDACGKGFVDNHSLSDHINVHTGEKPYKCKFCSSCFASRGTYAMHERSHLGRGRKIKK